MNDLSQLNYSDQEITDYFSRRFKEKEYFSWVGPVLVFVNPFTIAPQLYSQNQKITFWNDSFKAKNLEPHIFSVVKKAKKEVCFNSCKKDQIILLNGFSGSGKTVTSHIILDFLAADPNVTVTSRRHVDYFILALSLLDIFGNASIVNHKNASRHGRLISVRYNEQEIFPSVKTCCLELSRVINTTILGKRDEPEISHLQIDDEDIFKIANYPSSIMDHQDFLKTIKILSQLGFCPEIRKDIFNILGAILFLGNIDFIYLDQITVNTVDDKSKRAVKCASRLLGLEEIKLCELLTMKTISIKKKRRKHSVQPSRTLSSVEQCCNQRNSLMKFLYEKLFSFIEKEINKQWGKKMMNLEELQTKPTLEIVDPYGFEKFSENGIEQFCINNSNEKLHYFFTKHFLLQYKKMQLEDDLIPENNIFEVNTLLEEVTRCVQLFQSPSTISHLINKLSKDYYKKSKVFDLCTRILRNKRKKDKITVNIPDQQFTIQHYFGSVTYQAHDVLKNNVTLVCAATITKLLKSKNDFLGRIILPSDSTDKTVISQVTKFKPCWTSLLENLIRNSIQLEAQVLNHNFSECNICITAVNTLFHKLNTSDVHLVKCLSSNSNCNPRHINLKHLHKQIVLNGIIDLARIKHFKFSIRMKQEQLKRIVEIIIKHSDLYTHHLRKGPPTKNETVEIVLQDEIKNNEVKVGKKYIFLTENVNDKLQKQLTCSLAQLIYEAWKKYKLRKNLIFLQNYVHDLIKRNREKKIVIIKNSKHVQKLDKPRLNSKFSFNLKEEKIIVKIPRKAQSMDSDQTFKFSEFFNFRQQSVLKGSTTNNHLLQQIMFTPPIRSSFLDFKFFAENKESQLKFFKSNNFNFGNGIISRFSVCKVPIRFHTRSTALAYSHKLPRSELPLGVIDALSD